MKREYVFIFLVFNLLISKISATEFIGDVVIVKDTIFKGEVYIKGQVVIQAGVAVTVLPGTKIKFIKVDLNNDSIGESLINIQGSFIAKGTPGNQIIFTSAEENPSRGDWDGIFYVVSEGENNLIENCIIEYSYRGVHSHFSKLNVIDNKFVNNYRAMMFQESVIKIVGNMFENNNNAIRFRDSEVSVLKNNLQNNYTAISFFRSEVSIKNNVFKENILESIRSRESRGIIENNSLINNRLGVYINESSHVLKNNIISKNIENGISLRFCSATVIENNAIEWNGSHGISIESSHVEIKNNNLGFNQKYNIYLKDKSQILADNNWWGSIEDLYIKSKIYDLMYDTSLGSVRLKPFLQKPAEIEKYN